MDDVSAFERQVAAELVRRAGPVRPVDAAAVLSAVTAGSSPWRLQSVFSATKLVVAGAIVALFAGFLVTGVLPPSPQHAAPGAIGPADGSPTASLSPTPSPDVVVPRYEATAILKVDPGPDAGPDELMAAEAALLRYAAMAQTPEIAETVIAQLGLDDSPERLLERISVETSDETLVLSLRVSGADAEDARRIATTLGDELRQRVEDEVVTDEVKAADRAIAAYQRPIRALSNRLRYVQRKPNKTPLDRQETIALTGQIAALQADVGQLTPSSSASVRNRLEWLERPSILEQEERGDRPPQAELEPSVAVDADPTAEVEADTTTRSDLVPGVDLVTEEVEPGVFRVVSDGVRDLRRSVEDADQDAMSAAGPFDRSLHAAPDGSIWAFDPDGAFRLGQPDVIDVDWRGAPVIDDSLDGSMWASWRFPISRAGGDQILRLGRLQDGAWQGREVARDWSLPLADIAVGADGTFWAALWSGGCAEDASTEDGACGSSVAPLVDPLAQSSDELDGVLAPTLPKDHDYQGVVGLWATEDGSVWLLDAWENRQNRGFAGALSRFDGTSFERHDVPDWRFVRADMAADGTMWAVFRNWHVPTLGRFDGSGWTVFDRDDGVPSMSALYYDDDQGFFEVAPDGSVWLNPTEKVRAQGVARFDGDSLQRYLQDLRVYAMDVAPDGSIWLEAGSYSVSKGKEHFGPIDMYVITPEAIAATE